MQHWLWPALGAVGLVVGLQLLLTRLPAHGPWRRLQLQRKLQHMLAGATMLCLYVWLLPFPLALGLLTGALIASYGVHQARLRWPNLNTRLIARFDVLLRPREYRALPGAFWLLAGILATSVACSSSVTILAVLYVSIGDPIAGLVCELVGRRQSPHGARKSWYSTVAMAAVCAACTALALALIIPSPAALQHPAWLTDSGGNPLLVTDLTPYDWFSWLICGAIIPAITERSCAPMDDNFAIPTVSGLFFTALQTAGILAPI